MKRRDFLGKTTLALAAINTTPLFNIDATAGVSKTDLSGLLKDSIEVDGSAEVFQEFLKLIEWLKGTGWVDYLKSVSGVDLTLTGKELKQELGKPIFGLGDKPGFEDFAGNKMIEPGMPSMSLLYHALASPRVCPHIEGDKYSTLEHLDLLENYIYGLLDLKIGAKDLKENYVFAVFTYEYRPAFKTPDGCPHAEFVYSRTGIGRIGECALNYDAKSRSYTNKPHKDGTEKQIAVTPARYGLFLAKRVLASDICSMSEENADIKNFILFKKQRLFLQPVRKIFDGDLFINSGKVVFFESHVNEKLGKLAKRLTDYFPKGIYDEMKPPFVRTSLTNTATATKKTNQDLVEIRSCGSSAILSSIPVSIIRVAEQGDKHLSFIAPPHIRKEFESNRRYTSLKLQDNAIRNSIDYGFTEGVFKKHRPIRFSAPRNAPLFANIRNEVSKSDYKITRHLGEEIPDFEKKVFEGGYLTAMFEDSICDGCISAQVITKDLDSIISDKLVRCLPAFSLVTAPDFFPLADSFDLEQFDKNKDSSFLEGGTENLSTARLGANPAIIDPINFGSAFRFSKMRGNTQYEEPSAAAIATPENNLIEYEVSDTISAIVSGFHKPTNENYKGDKELYAKPYLRDYQVTSYMPDTASFIFAPGWDVTYAGVRKENIYMATSGLGSPFPEDMKLCAAANGMWPVASPDAARTFFGSLDPLPILGIRTPTAVPLMDNEIGIHDSHPAIKEKGLSLKANYGWDGEQGPFFERFQDKFWINFTDIGRADYVNNLRTPEIGFNMSMLRELDCKELVSRIDCLRKCKKSIEGLKPKFSRMWLVSAEKIDDWSSGATAIGVPIDMIGQDRGWAAHSDGKLTGSGFLFVYADPVFENKKSSAAGSPNWVSGKRRRMATKNIVLCQVTASALRWCTIPPEGLLNTSAIQWTLA